MHEPLHSVSAQVVGGLRSPPMLLLLKQNDVILSENRPLRAASGSVHRVLRLVPLLRDPNYSEQGRDRGAQAVRAGRYTICTAP